MIASARIEEFIGRYRTTRPLFFPKLTLRQWREDTGSTEKGPAPVVTGH